MTTWKRHFWEETAPRDPRPVKRAFQIRMRANVYVAPPATHIKALESTRRQAHFHRLPALDQRLEFILPVSAATRRFEGAGRLTSLKAGCSRAGRDERREFPSRARAIGLPTVDGQGCRTGK